MNVVISWEYTHHTYSIEVLTDISLSKRVLGCYIPGLSELQLGNHTPLLLTLAGPFQWFFVLFISLAWHFRPFFLFSSFVSCAYVYSEHDTAGEPGAVAGVSGCWRVEGGLQGAQSQFSWLGVARVPRDTRDA